MPKVLIIGGMAGGCKTAARLRRLKPEWDITIVEEKDFLSYGSCGMPFYASGDIDDFYDLAKTPWGVVRDADYFEKVKNINVHLNTKIIEIMPDDCKAFGFNSKNKEIIEFPYDYLVLATGSIPIQHPFEISDNVRYFHSPEDARLFKQKAQRGEIEKAVIIGGGYIGCELTEALVSLWGIETSMIEMGSRIIPKSFDNLIASLLEKIIQENGIKIFKNSKVESITQENGKPVVNFGSSAIQSDYVFICPGVKPNTFLAENIGLNLGVNGGILVNEKMQTSIPNIYAVGDCVEIKDLVTGTSEVLPLGSLANRQGRVAADNIAGINSHFDGAVGSVSLKIFGVITAACGITENKAKLSGINCASVCGCWYDRPDYMPESKLLFAQMVYKKEDMKLLGLQILGRGEVTRYCDAFAVYLKNTAKVEELLNFEHCYTPPHSSPMNPLNFLSALAIEQEKNDVICLNPDNIVNLEDAEFIDLREKDEIESAPIDFASKRIPINEIRQVKSQIDLNKHLVFVCQKGPRSYEFAKYFKSIGAKNVAYLGGGVQMYKKMLDLEE